MNQTTKTSSGASSSSEEFVEFHFFPCGHGDTVLVRCPDGRWGVIDCYLPKRNGIRQAFFDFLDTLGITELSFVVLTHPDIDHYLGMHDLLLRFSSNGRTVGLFGDSGITGHQVRSVFGGRTMERKEYSRLRLLVKQLRQRKAIRRTEFDDNSLPLRIRGQVCMLSLHPVAPSVEGREDAVDAAIVRIASGEEYACSLPANVYSVVFVALLQSNDADAIALLAADSEADTLAQALGRWREHGFVVDPMRFSVVKVPHHGSRDSHIPQLVESSPAVLGRVAVVCAGDRAGLPAASVLGDYLSHDWQVFLTTTRTVKAPRGKSYAIDLLSRRRPSRSVECHRQPVTVRWQLGEAPIVTAATRLDISDLAAYA